MTPMKRNVATIALVLSGAFALGLAAQSPPAGKQSAPLILKSTYGADLYQFYCGGCHGVTARGGRPRSAQHPPAPDLTALARRNNGVFPRERVRSTIAFGPTAVVNGAHGTSDMPVWGTVFRGLDGNDTLTEIRIENLLQYLASLQDDDALGQ